MVILGLGFCFVFLPLGIFFIVAGLLLALNGWPRFPWVVVHRSDLKAKRISNDRLGQKCADLGEKIASELADYHREDPRMLAWGSNYPALDTPKGEAQTKRENEYDAKFRARYSQRYAADVQWVLAELAERDVVDPSEVWQAQNGFLGGAHGLSQLVNLLGIASNRLKGGGGDTPATTKHAGALSTYFNVTT